MSFGIWEITEEIGKGCHGRCYLVKRAGNVNHPFVLKTPVITHLGRFRHEVEALKRLDHPSVLRLVDYDLHIKNPYMVTEYAEGGTLADVDFTKWSLKDKERLVTEICNGFAYIHSKGICMWDVKLENILLRHDNPTREQPIIADFGNCTELSSYRDAGSEMVNLTHLFYEIFTGHNIGKLTRHEKKEN